MNLSSMCKCTTLWTDMDEKNNSFNFHSERWTNPPLERLWIPLAHTMPFGAIADTTSCLRQPTMAYQVTFQIIPRVYTINQALHTLFLTS